MASENSTPAGSMRMETIVTAVACAVLLLALAATLRMSFESRAIAEHKHARNEAASDYLTRLLRLPFGSPDQPAASAEQLTELFDDDDDHGTVTLSQLRVPHDEDGHGFARVLGGTTTAWRIRVCSDLDGDGHIGGPREGREDLLNIEVHVDGRLALRTLRAADSGIIGPGGGR